MSRPLIGSRATAAVVAVAALTLTACSDDGGGAADPDPSASPTSAASDPGSASASASESASAEPTPEPTGVAPAAGPLITVGTSSLHAPEGWKDDGGVSSEQASAAAPEGAGLIIVNEFESMGDYDLETIAKAARQSLPDDAKITRLPDVELGDDATPAARFTYTDADDGEVHDYVVTQRAGQSISVSVDVDAALLAQQPDLVDSVLASWAWVSGGAAS